MTIGLLIAVGDLVGETIGEPSSGENETTKASGREAGEAQLGPSATAFESGEVVLDAVVWAGLGLVGVAATLAVRRRWGRRSSEVPAGEGRSAREHPRVP